MKLPRFTCAPGCTACCTLVPFTDGDKRRISALRPDLAWTRWGKSWVLTQALEALRCPLLGESGCTIHGTTAYPDICRLYGIVDSPKMTCKRGGEANGKISETQARRLMRKRA